MELARRQARPKTIGMRKADIFLFLEVLAFANEWQKEEGRKG